MHHLLLYNFIICFFNTFNTLNRKNFIRPFAFALRLIVVINTNSLLFSQSNQALNQVLNHQSSIINTLSTIL